VDRTRERTQKNYAPYPLEINLKEIGPLIKSAREHKNITLDSLAESLKISKDYLIAIENGTRKFLPEIIYVRAMIKRISEKLEIDLNKLLSDSNSNDSKDQTKNESLREVNSKIKISLILIISLIAFILGAVSSRFGFKVLIKNNYEYQNPDSSLKIIPQEKSN